MVKHSSFEAAYAASQPTHTLHIIRKVTKFDLRLGAHRVAASSKSGCYNDELAFFSEAAALAAFRDASANSGDFDDPGEQTVSALLLAGSETLQTFRL